MPFDRSTARCDACTFWNGDIREFGDCRRHPPVFTGADEVDWPRTHAESWCGEFEPAPKSAERPRTWLPARKGR